MSVKPKSPSATQYTALFGLVREHLWVPDGKAPAGWDDRREGSVLKQLLLRHHHSHIEVAILGLAQLRERGQIDWLKPGQKCTTRALYHTRSGVCQMFELATQEYWRTVKRTPKRQVGSLLGDVLMHSLRQSETYKWYIKSPEWKTRRGKALARAGSRCQRCKTFGVPLDVHHLTYQNLGKERDDELEVLCLPCHKGADAERANRTFGEPAA